jgi:hypothetical protein
LSLVPGAEITASEGKFPQPEISNCKATTAFILPGAVTANALKSQLLRKGGGCHSTMQGTICGFKKAGSETIRGTLAQTIDCAVWS